MAFPTTPVLDAFTRANVGPPPSASWTNDPRGSGAPGLAVVSNQAKALTAGPGVEQGSYWNAATFRNDCEAYFTAVTANPEFELWCRGSGLGGALPQAYLIYYHPSTSELLIQKYGPGGAAYYVTLGAAISGVTIAAGDSIGISVVGTTISAWQKVGAGAWALLGSRTDTSFASGGQVGVLLFDNTAIIDSFGGGSANVPISPTGTISPAGALSRKLSRTLTALVTPHGAVSIGRSRTQTGLITPAGALVTVKTVAPIVIAPYVYPDGMDEMLYAALPWEEAQAQLAMPGVEGNPIAASCGWHGESFDSHRGSFAIVARDGPLADMVGERLALTRRDTGTSRTVYVYCLRDSDELTEEISVTRRAFMGLGDPALDDVPVVVDTVGAL